MSATRPDPAAEADTGPAIDAPSSARPSTAPAGGSTQPSSDGAPGVAPAGPSAEAIADDALGPVAWGGWRHLCADGCNCRPV